MSCVGGCLRSEKCPSIVGQWTTLAIDERRRARRARVQSFVQSSAAAAALQSARRGAGVAGHALDWSVFHWCRRSSTSDASKSSSSLAAITWFNPSPTQPTPPLRRPISYIPRQRSRSKYPLSLSAISVRVSVERWRAAAVGQWAMRAPHHRNSSTQHVLIINRRRLHDKDVVCCRQLVKVSSCLSLSLSLSPLALILAAFWYSLRSISATPRACGSLDVLLGARRLRQLVAAQGWWAVGRTGAEPRPRRACLCWVRRQVVCRGATRRRPIDGATCCAPHSTTISSRRRVISWWCVDGRVCVDLPVRQCDDWLGGTW